MFFCVTVASEGAGSDLFAIRCEGYVARSATGLLNTTAMIVPAANVTSAIVEQTSRRI